jgi:hypothetical protein
MTAITVNNTDWTILNAVKTALASATVNAQAVFATVSATASADQARQCQQGSRTPVAVVRYVGTTEASCGGGEYFGVVELEILLATRVARGVNESSAIQEALRLVNAAKNAVMAAVPAAAKPVGNEKEFHEAVEWGQPRIEAGSSDAPWVAATLPVRMAYPVTSATAH